MSFNAPMSTLKRLSDTCLWDHNASCRDFLSVQISIGMFVISEYNHLSSTDV